jgi:predicted nuclease with TOPRIM domain
MMDIRKELWSLLKLTDEEIKNEKTVLADPNEDETAKGVASYRLQQLYQQKSLLDIITQKLMSQLKDIRKDD